MTTDLYFNPENRDFTIATSGNSAVFGWPLITNIDDNNWNIDGTESDDLLGAFARQTIRDTGGFEIESYDGDGTHVDYLTDQESIEGLFMAMIYVRDGMRERETAND